MDFENNPLQLEGQRSTTGRNPPLVGPKPGNHLPLG